MTNLRLERYRAAYAASGRRVRSGDVSSADGRLTTTARETDEGTLVITVIASAFASLVRVGWTLLYPDGVGPSHRLVTPLASSRRGYVAAYDVGDVRNALAVEVAPAELVGVALPRRSEVDAAFEAVQLGSARRAWLAALRNGVLTPWMEAQVLEQLSAEPGAKRAEPC